MFDARKMIDTNLSEFDCECDDCRSVRPKGPNLLETYESEHIQVSNFEHNRAAIPEEEYSDDIRSKCLFIFDSYARDLLHSITRSKNNE